MEKIQLKEVLSDDFWIMPATPKYIETGIPYITSKNIKDGKINFENTKFISKDDFEKISKNRPIQKNDILISMIGTLGEIAVVSENDDIFYGQNMFLVRLNENKISQRYFINFFKSNSVKNQLMIKQNKSTQSYLKANHIEELLLPIPPLDIQIKIANKLDKVQEIINTKKIQIKELDSLIKSQFVEINNNLNDYKTCPIGDIYKFQYGKGNNIPESKGIYPCYGSNGQVGFHTEYNNEDAPIIGHIGAYAGIVVWAPGKHFVTYNGVMCFLKDYSLVNPKYGYYLLKNQDFLNNSRRGGAQPFVSYDMLEAPIVNIPPIELQNQFAEFADHIDKLEFELKKSLEEMQNLFDSLMAEYFE